MEISKLDQMIQEIEENARREFVVATNGVTIKAKDAPKYEALLKLQKFLNQNQNIFTELSSLAANAGLSASNIVSSYNEINTMPLSYEQTSSVYEVPKSTDSSLAASSVPTGVIDEPDVRIFENSPKHYEDDPLQMPKKEVQDQDTFTPAFEEMPKGQDADALSDKGFIEDLPKFSISTFAMFSSIEFSLKYPENPVDVHQELNRWIMTNLPVPIGYIAYGKVNDDDTAEIYLGELKGITWQKEKDDALYESIRKELTLYYDQALYEDISAFERKYNISRLDAEKMPLRINKKRGFNTYSAPVEDSQLSPKQEENKTVSHPKINDYIFENSINISVSHPDNKFMIHDGVRKWINTNIIVPEGYVLYVGPIEDNKTVVYLGKKTENITPELHMLKAMNVEQWESKYQVERVDSKAISLNLNDLITAIDDNIIKKPVISYEEQAPVEQFIEPPQAPQQPVVEVNKPDDSVQSSQPDDEQEEREQEGILESIGDRISSWLHPEGEDKDDYEDEYEDEDDYEEPYIRTVVGRKLAQWTESLSKTKLISGALRAFDRLNNNAGLYTEVCNQLDNFDPASPDARVTLNAINKTVAITNDLTGGEKRKLLKRCNKLFKQVEKEEALVNDGGLKR